MRSVVSEKGQVTIPKAVRDRLGLAPGTEIEFEAVGGQLIGRKAIREDVFSKWRGRARLPQGQTVNQYLRRVRDADDD
jgi:antitoxin PrlF